MFKVDLHTHSKASPDSNLGVNDYYQMVMQSGDLDCVAVTDHNTLKYAKEQIQRAIGERIIVGEEVSTSDGHLIGLYLTEPIERGKTAAAAADEIHEQDGLVYVPHPGEKVRQGIAMVVLDRMPEKIDIVERYNGRKWSNRPGRRASKWAKDHGIAVAASSDAHGRHGWGSTYSVLAELPTRETLLELLADAQLVKGHVGLRGLLYPKFNRWIRPLWSRLGKMFGR